MKAWRPSLLGLVAAAAVATASCGALSADPAGTMLFDLVLDGSVAGQLHVDSTASGKDYRAEARIEPQKGQSLAYAASAEGLVASGRPQPTRYMAHDGLGDTEARFSGGAPYVAVDGPLAHPNWIANLSALKGAIDPLTALWMVTRDQPVAEACHLRVFLYDGRHLAQLVLYVPDIADGEVTCQGEYRRLNGFTPAEMAERQRFPFYLTYGAAGPGNVGLREARFETLTGFGVLKRR